MPSSVFGGDANLQGWMQTVRGNLTVSGNQLRRVIALMQREMEKVSNNSSLGSSLRMLVSHVRRVPKLAQSDDDYLALDLGGTNFRILLIRIKESRVNNRPAQIEIVTEVYAFPDDVLIDGKSFFDHIAKCMASFCKLYGVHKTSRPVPVGFTFSFPLHQEHLSHAVLIDWAKGFDVSGVIGNDVVEMLVASLQKRNDINCKIIAVVNDTVATLVTCAHSDQSCKIGLIVGTGCNACYMEEAKNIPGLRHTEGQMCINMEWGTFGGNGILDEFRNEYDREVDLNSGAPNSAVYEKMISSRYLGELVRLVLCKLASQGVIFHDQHSSKLFTTGSFPASFVYLIERPELNHNFGAYFTVRNLLTSFGITASDTDCEMVKEVCHLVSTRAAHMCAAGVAAVALKIKSNHPIKKQMTITVAVDGTMYKKHPTFAGALREKVDELCVGSGLTVQFSPSYEGSGKGAALVAASVHQEMVKLPNDTYGLILS